jgi:hypothetical protein
MGACSSSMLTASTAVHPKSEDSALLPSKPEAPPPPLPPAAPSYVPGRSLVLASSIVFVLASLLLLTEFVCIAAGSSAALINTFGAAEGVGWAVGFALLLDWQVEFLFPAIGVSRRALAGCVCKLVAAVFFNVQPWSWIIAGDLTERGGSPCALTGVGVPWSNFVGIILFHTGNTIDALGMASSFDRTSPLALSNAPVIGMWIFWIATQLLVVADTIVYVETPPPFGPGGNTGISPTSVVLPMQMMGAMLLGAGSLLYTCWAWLPAAPR